MTNHPTILFVDDYKSPEWYDLRAEDIQVCKTGDEALKWAKKKHIDVLYLDHDLGTGWTGADVLEELIEFGNPPSRVVIISLNPVGIARIKAICQYHNIPCSQHLPPDSITIRG